MSLLNKVEITLVFLVGAFVMSGFFDGFEVMALMSIFGFVVWLLYCCKFARLLILGWQD